MKKVITLFSFLILLIVSLPNMIAQNNPGNQGQMEASLDQDTYAEVKLKCKAINKLLNLSSNQYDELVEIKMHSEVKKIAILNNEFGENHAKHLAELSRFEMENLSHVFNARQLIRYQEWLGSN